MIEVKSFKDMDGNTVKIGDKVLYVSVTKECEDVRQVRRITKEGYFISVYVEGFIDAWYMPRVCVRKVESK